MFTLGLVCTYRLFAGVEIQLFTIRTLHPLGKKINTILPLRLVIYLVLVCVCVQSALEEQNNTFPFILLWKHLAEGYCFGNKILIVSAIS